MMNATNSSYKIVKSYPKTWEKIWRLTPWETRAKMRWCYEWPQILRSCIWVWMVPRWFIGKIQGTDAWKTMDVVKFIMWIYGSIKCKKRPKCMPSMWFCNWNCFDFEIARYFALVLSKPALGFSLGCHHESTLSCRNSIPEVLKLLVVVSILSTFDPEIWGDDPVWLLWYVSNGWFNHQVFKPSRFQITLLNNQMIVLEFCWGSARLAWFLFALRYRRYRYHPWN